MGKEYMMISGLYQGIYFYSRMLLFLEKLYIIIKMPVRFKFIYSGGE